MPLKDEQKIIVFFFLILNFCISIILLNIMVALFLFVFHLINSPKLKIFFDKKKIIVFEVLKICLPK